jgi:hypothetical protein
MSINPTALLYVKGQNIFRKKIAKNVHLSSPLAGNVSDNRTNEKKSKKFEEELSKCILRNNGTRISPFRGNNS